MFTSDGLYFFML